MTEREIALYRREHGLTPVHIESRGLSPALQNTTAVTLIPPSPMSSKRRPPAPWSRLKAATVDPLESVGLVSKGDERLLQLKRQESYFSTIVTRYMRLTADSGPEKDDLAAAFASLDLREAATPPAHVKASPGAASPAAATTATTSSEQELSTIIMAMRKLREGLVATGRADAFARRALTFITRATILTATYEAYYPSLARLLDHVHRKHPLTVPELREFVGYRVLDLACRQGALAEALCARQAWGLRDDRVERVLQSLIRNDWVCYWRVAATLDGYQRRLVGFAEDGMRRHALKCLGRSYLSVDRQFLEQSAGRSWAELQRLDAVGWELDGERVIIRKIKRAG